uniref:Candidate secreted effector n=1 Tax=Meloidogyne incognita TaxID=6306 RepID=A0A914LFX0_MELIC
MLFPFFKIHLISAGLRGCSCWGRLGDSWGCLFWCRCCCWGGFSWCRCRGGLWCRGSCFTSRRGGCFSSGWCCRLCWCCSSCMSSLISITRK